MTTLILHYAPDNASLCIRLALEAVGAPYQTHLVDRRAQAHRSDAYLSLNPNGKIPVLETPDGVMFETAAILLWMAERYPSLLPDDPIPRAAALKWFIWMANTLHPTLQRLFYPEQYIDAEHSNALRTFTQNALRRHLGTLEEALDGASWIGQSAPTLLDCYLCPMLRWMQIYPDNLSDKPMLADYPRLLRVARVNESHPGTNVLQKAEGLGPHPFTKPTLPDPPEGNAL
ncbi:MAG: glutathione S-transferase family protein [Pseudomonadota bacterium]